MAQEADAGIRIENFVPRRGEGYGHQPAQGDQGHKDITNPRHFDNDGGGDTERDRRQQLVADAEERPERINASQRILDALPEEISPGSHDHGTGKKNRWIPTGAAERLPDVAE